MHIKESIIINDKKLTIETGKIAKQADGSVTIKYGDSLLLCTVVASKKPKENATFLPLTVDYVEKDYAAGKIPGNFFRREGRLGEKEILASRLIDRPIRPLFPEGWSFNTQVITTVLSHDKTNPTPPLAQIGASVALCISDIPWNGPIAGIQIARIDGEFIQFPTLQELEESDLDLNIVASDNAIVMVEGELDNLDEDILLDALDFGFQKVQPILEMQKKLADTVGKKKRPAPVVEKDEELAKLVSEAVREPLEAALNISDKLERYAAIDRVKDLAMENLGPDYEERKNEVMEAMGELKSQIVRNWILNDNHRIDNRERDEIRPITCEIDILPRAHGSALFTRGETQAIVTTTLGFGMDNQKLDLITGEEFRKFMLHYDFPPYSVGEAKFLRGPSRREIGHGHLAHRAVGKILPSEDDFPSVIRVVSEITESNGSSSMATICGASLSLMACGVPTKAPVAGIAMGLIKEDDNVAILSDILGDEDHMGDMDFKVAGTEEGITAIQMDIKIEGLDQETMKKALYQAREGRLHILGIMKETIEEPREELPDHAPSVKSITIKPSKIGAIIGAGGKTIKGIQEETGAKIDIEDSGKVLIAADTNEGALRARQMIKNIVMEPEIDKYYEGYVKKILENFGAIVQFLPNTDGLIHISEIEDRHIDNITDVVNINDRVIIKVVDIDKRGRIRLSRKQAFDASEDEITRAV
ncbi:MAG: polyribonucleotide nucleotidyltransferase [Deltaproteobacteria bacterium]|jgi:polyribonucleotide nucleotidyltransferase|nr:polyribonucleotide nucleotidyltransferase [Deltaproteobacteria bacterium]